MAAVVMHLGPEIMRPLPLHQEDLVLMGGEEGGVVVEVVDTGIASHTKEETPFQ